MHRKLLRCHVPRGPGAQSVSLLYQTGSCYILAAYMLLRVSHEPSGEEAVRQSGELRRISQSIEYPSLGMLRTATDISKIAGTQVCRDSPPIDAT